MADVLEHLPHPSSVLKKLKKNLKKEGYFIISVPNVANWSIRFRLLFGKFDYTEYGILDKSHLRFFTRKSLERLIEEVGLKIKKLEVTPNIPFISYNDRTARLAYELTKLWKGLLACQFIVKVVK